MTIDNIGATVLCILFIAFCEILTYKRGYKKGYEIGQLEERIKNQTK